jgi:serine/threonine-protein kinase
VADLFVSYKSEDRARVKPLVEALQADGLSVWWDAQIEGGAGWRQRIEQELTSAACVLVAWTKRSAGPEGEFVHDEATRAKRRGVYLPVLLEKVELPLGFGEKQALPLTGWKGDRADARYQAVLAAAKTVVSGTPLPAGSAVSAGPSLGRRAVIGGGVALGAAALGGAGWYFLRPGAAEAKAESIAVLPFANLSGDPGQAWFADGLAEELRSALTRIAGLQVAARTSSEKMRDADIKEAADKLGVAHVLTGSVRKGEGKVRVSAQLANGETGLEEWSEVYDRAEGDALVVQTSIAESVANRLSLTLGKAGAMLGGTKNPVAYEAFLKGIAIKLTGNAEAANRAKLAAYDAAVAADPSFAAAHAFRVLSLTNLSHYAGSAEGISRYLELAAAAAERAIALEPKLPLGHAGLGYTRMLQLDFRGADAAFNVALALPGVGSRELSLVGQFPVLMGRSEEGLALLDKSVALDPLNPARQRIRIAGLGSARRFVDMLTAVRAYNAAFPDDPYDPGVTAFALLWSGDARQALEVSEEDEEVWRRYWLQAIASAKLGDRAGSDKALASLKAIDDGTLGFQFATIHAVRGETELAFAQLDHALKSRDPGLLDLRVDPAFDGIRKDPRFAAIEKRLGFPAV